MNNYVEPGEVLPFTAPAGGVVAGTPYLIGAIVVVATVTAAAGEKFSGYVGVGVIAGPKAVGNWTEGMKVNWDDTAKKFTAGAGTLVGIAAAAAGSADTTGLVRLDGVAR